MSSYNNYEGIEAAYTPGHPSDIRGRLFFKMAFDKNNNVLRESPDHRSGQGFFNPNDPRWQDALAAQQELDHFSEDSTFDLRGPAALAPAAGPMLPGAVRVTPIQHIVNSIQKVKRNSSATLKRKMLDLFNLVYRFTVGGANVTAEQVTTAAGLGVVVRNAPANLAASAGAVPAARNNNSNIFNFHFIKTKVFICGIRPIILHRCIYCRT